MATPNAHDDTPLDLPPSDGAASDDDVAPAELFDDALVGEHDDESIGLDASVGFDRDEDLASLLDDVGSEELRWSDGGETSGELIRIDDRDISADDTEYGWTQDNEAAGDAIAHRDDDVDDDQLPPLGDDEGETGLDEGTTGEAGDDVALPPLDASAEDGDSAAGTDASLLGQLDRMVDAEPEPIELVPGVRLHWFARASVRLEHLGVTQANSRVVHVGATACIVSDTLVSRLRGEPREFRVPGTPVCITADSESASGYALSTSTGLFRVGGDGTVASLDGPSADPALIAGATLVESQLGQSRALWAMSRLGSLFALKAEPTRWTLVDAPRPGSHLASDGRRSLAFVCAVHSGATLVRSGDGGKSWETRSLPRQVDPQLLRQMFVCRDVVIFVSDSMTTPVLATIAEAEPESPVPELRAPVALSYEDGEVTLYGCVMSPRGVYLVRQPMGRPRRAASVIHCWLAGEALPTSLSAHYDGAITEILAVAGDEIVRLQLEITPDNIGRSA